MTSKLPKNAAVENGINPRTLQGGNTNEDFAVPPNALFGAFQIMNDKRIRVGTKHRRGSGRFSCIELRSS